MSVSGSGMPLAQTDVSIDAAALRAERAALCALEPDTVDRCRL